jgi:hypothetical protein
MVDMHIAIRNIGNVDVGGCYAAAIAIAGHCHGRLRLRLWLAIARIIEC